MFPWVFDDFLKSTNLGGHSLNNINMASLDQFSHLHFFLDNLFEPTKPLLHKLPLSNKPFNHLLKSSLMPFVINPRT